MEENQIKFEKNLIIKGKIKLKTGLHIGGLQETVKIGGTDSPALLGWKKYEGDKKPRIVPIIPGSSLKGKIRSLLDLKYAMDIRSKEEWKSLSQNEQECYHQIGEVYIQYPEKNVIPTIFGIGAREGKGKFNRTRLVVRDAYPTETTVEEWELNEDLIHGTEVKGENTINRITSAANPRFIERIPAESEFDIEMILSVYSVDEESNMLETIFEGLKLLEDNYLGGMGTRGYGKVEFTDIEIKEKKAEDYEEGKEGEYYKIHDTKIENKTPEEILGLLKG